MADVFAIVQVIELALIAYLLIRPKPAAERPAPAIPQISAPPVQEFVDNGYVELLQKRGGRWQHHSWRPEGHPDIDTALDTPGLAIARNGVMDEGRQ